MTSRLHRWRAFTLVEVLCVLAIIALLAALTFSVSGPVRMAALESNSRQNLQQIYLALQLYREAQGGGAEYGTASEMGMPDFTWEMKPFLAQGAVGAPSLWKSPCGDHPVPPNYPTDHNTLLVYLSNQEWWAQESARDQARTVVVSDPNCNSEQLNLLSPVVESKYLVLRLDGSVRAEHYFGLPALTDYRN